MWKKKIRQHLASKLESTGGNDTPSMRAFADQIGLSSGALSEILSGKRKLTLKTAKRLVEFLDLDEESRSILVKAIDDDASQSRTLLHDEAYDLVSNWVYFAILAVLEIDHPPRTAEEVAKLLGLKEQEGIEALATLDSYGYVRKTEAGEYETLNQTFTTTDEQPSSVIAERHMNNLRIAMSALAKIPMRERDFTSITFSANSDRLRSTKSDIRKFLDGVADGMSHGRLNQVYQMSVQLFPIAGWEKPHGSTGE